MDLKKMFPLIAGIIFVAIVCIVLMVSGTKVGKNTYQGTLNFIESGLASFGFKMDIDGNSTEGGSTSLTSQDAVSGLDDFDPTGIKSVEGFTNQ